MEMQIDPGLASPGSLLGNGHFMLGLLEEYYFVRSIEMASVSVIVLWVLCPFSWTAPPAVLVFWGAKIDGHSSKLHLCTHIMDFPP